LSSDGIVGPITGKELNSLYITKDGQSNNTQPRQEKVNAIISTAKKYMGVPIYGVEHLLRQVLTVQVMFSMSLPKTGFHYQEFPAINNCWYSLGV